MTHIEKSYNELKHLPDRDIIAAKMGNDPQTDAHKAAAQILHERETRRHRVTHAISIASIVVSVILFLLKR